MPNKCTNAAIVNTIDHLSFPYGQTKNFHENKTTRKWNLVSFWKFANLPKEQTTKINSKWTKFQINRFKKNLFRYAFHKKTIAHFSFIHFVCGTSKKCCRFVFFVWISDKNQSTSIQNREYTIFRKLFLPWTIWYGSLKQKQQKNVFDLTWLNEMHPCWTNVRERDALATKRNFFFRIAAVFVWGSFQ